MRGFGIFGIGEKHGNQELGVENIDAHRGVAVSGLVRRNFGLGGLFLETYNSPVPVRFDNPKLLGRFLGRDFDRGDRNVGTGVNMLLKHLGVIHFVDVVAGKNEDVFGTFAANRVDVLINGVGSALIPLLRDA